MRYFSSDSHLGHQRILELGDGRPFQSLQQMNWTILNNIFEVVTAEDEFYHLGDAAMGNFDETIHMLSLIPAKRKYFVPGNHDKIFPKLNSAERIARFLPRYEEAGFEVLPLHSTITIEVDSVPREVLISHVPYSPERYSRRQDKLAFARPEDRGLPLVHGHTHQSFPLSDHPREYSVGVDAHAFKPVPETTIQKWLRTVK